MYQQQYIFFPDNMLTQDSMITNLYYRKLPQFPMLHLGHMGFNLNRAIKCGKARHKFQQNRQPSLSFH
jgi:hypothetical protein